MLRGLLILYRVRSPRAGFRINTFFALASSVTPCMYSPKYVPLPKSASMHSFEDMSKAHSPEVPLFISSSVVPVPTHDGFWRYSFKMEHTRTSANSTRRYDSGELSALGGTDDAKRCCTVYMLCSHACSSRFIGECEVSRNDFNSPVTLRAHGPYQNMQSQQSNNPTLHHPSSGGGRACSLKFAWGSDVAVAGSIFSRQLA